MRYRARKYYFSYCRFSAWGSLFQPIKQMYLIRSFVTQENLQGNEDPKKWLNPNIFVLSLIKSGMKKHNRMKRYEVRVINWEKLQSPVYWDPLNIFPSSEIKYASFLCLYLKRGSHGLLQG